MWGERSIVEIVHVCFLGNRVHLDCRVGDGWGEAGGKLMEKYCRQMCVFVAMEMMVTIIWPITKQSSFRSNYRHGPWSFYHTFGWLPCTICVKKVEKVKWLLKTLIVSPGLGRRGWHWEGRAFSELPSLLSLVTWLDFSLAMLCICASKHMHLQRAAIEFFAFD